MSYPEIRDIPVNPEEVGICTYFPHVKFTTIGDTELTMEIVVPNSGIDRVFPGQPPKPPKKRFPLIVFIQGSGWTSPNYCQQFIQVCQLARSGYVVASITHRNCFRGNPAPAFLEDSKTAIRFLRAHADEYCIDVDKVCAFGTSSGGNTAQLIGVTGDDPQFKTGEYAEYSDAVQAVVSCFGPSDMRAILTPEEGEPDPRFNMMRDHFLAGDLSKAALVSPITYLTPDKKFPPFLLAHGTDDVVILYEQSLKMFYACIDNGVDAEMIRVQGANHEGSFWGNEIYAAIEEFITRKLKG